MEFENIVKDIINNNEFKKLDKISHHGVNRLNHSLMVAKYSYKVSKFLKLNYKAATRGAMLHDFFFTNNLKLTRKEKVLSVLTHPKIARDNAVKYFDISYLEEDIILSHMFPIYFKVPRYIESWLVDVIDNYVSIIEKSTTVKKQLKTAFTFLFISALNYL